MHELLVPFFPHLLDRLGPRVFGCVVIHIVSRSDEEIRPLGEDGRKRWIAKLLVGTGKRSRKFRVVLDHLPLRIDSVIPVKLGIVHPRHDDESNRFSRLGPGMRAKLSGRSGTEILIVRSNSRRAAVTRSSLKSDECGSCDEIVFSNCLNALGQAAGPMWVVGVDRL